ncbi:hypothetical protein ACOJBO_41065 [Rhizobium beringeri]
MTLNRVDLSFVIDDTAAVLIFAQAELACKSWRSAVGFHAELSRLGA